VCVCVCVCMCMYVCMYVYVCVLVVAVRADHCAAAQAAAALVVLLALFVAPRLGPPGAGGATYGHTVYSSRAVVSTTHIDATRAGLAALAEGGNAVDAGAVVQFMLAVVQPQSTGIGGGCLILGVDPRGAPWALDGREEAPAAFSETEFCADPPNCTAAIPFKPERCTGGHPVGVPGVVAATAAALAARGTFTLARALAPAIGAARDGFVMYARLYDLIAANAGRLALWPASRALYLNAAGNAPRVPVGGVFTNPDLAAFLSELSDRGAVWFYNGPPAAEIVAAAAAAVNPTSGKAVLLSVADFAGYAAVARPVLTTPLPAAAGSPALTLLGFPPPSAGGVTIAQELLLLLQLAQLGGSGGGGGGGASAAAVARSIDAQNIAFADRGGYVGDADWVDVPLAAMRDSAYLAARAAAYAGRDPTPPTPLPAGSPPWTSCDRGGGGVASDAGASAKTSTTHFSIVDADGGVVAWTTTVRARAHTSALTRAHAHRIMNACRLRKTWGRGSSCRGAGSCSTTS
jgi:gamma-glutamyltranspeptidase/glutathione hydrolase